MATDVTVVNQALRRLGANTITALSDATTEGRLANDTYTEIRDDLLADHPWDFAIKRTTLTKDATDPTWGFSYAYVVPADFLRLLEVDGQDCDAVKIERMAAGLVILTDLESPISIRYVAQITDPDEMDVKFRKALSLRCALEWAEPLTGTNTLFEAVAREYTQAVQDARGVDGQTGTPDVMGIDHFERSRN